MGKQVASLWRFYFVILILLLATLCLFWRMVDLNILQRGFLLQQSDARILRIVSISAYRGMITDRFHQPLAISAGVDSIWINPKLFAPTLLQLSKLSAIIKIPLSKIQNKTIRTTKKEFIYLKRGLSPSEAQAVKILDIPGLFFQHDYHRFYPQSEVMAHVIGFTNIDDEGQEGLELAYDTWLRGIPGKKKVVKDRLGNIIADLGIMREPKHGNNLTLSIDSRIQYLAYEQLKDNVQKYAAKSGSIVVLDVKTGEVLAMVNQPSFNPNILIKFNDGRYRNRAMTDLFEPGSTIKAFTIASALESGHYHFGSKIDTSPGWINLNGYPIKDDHNYGVINLVKILQKSSDVGVAKVILSLPDQNLWKFLNRVGFGEKTNSYYPGEAAGTLVYRPKWSSIELATLSFGYGIAVTPIQLAQAYSIIAANGVKRPVSLLKIDQLSEGKRVLNAKISKQMLLMLEAVVNGGTGSLAKIPGFRVAGKTGTAYVAGKNGYDKQHYFSSFVGIAPVSNPTLVVAVVIKDPKGEQHSGGLVAAPIFAQVMSGALRLLNVSPDDLEGEIES